MPKWLDIARSKVGQHEVAGSADNPFIRECLAVVGLSGAHDETAWCGAFVAWCLSQCGIAGPRNQTGPAGAWAPAWANWGRGLTVPMPGAVCVIRRRLAGPDAVTGSSSGAHVGFWLGQDATAVRLLGGNQADAVSEAGFMLRGYEIVACRWPAEGVWKK